MGGLHREVYLYSTPHTFLQDVQVRAQPGEGDAGGTLEAVVSVATGELLTGPPADAQVLLQLYAPDGQAVFAQPLTPQARAAGTPRHQLSFSAPVPAPELWSAERPALYTAVVMLSGPDDTLQDCTSVRCGFRHVEVRARQLLINGQPVRILGVNRHDHDDTRGSAVTR